MKDLTNEQKQILKRAHQWIERLRPVMESVKERFDEAKLKFGIGGMETARWKNNLLYLGDLQFQICTINTDSNLGLAIISKNMENSLEELNKSMDVAEQILIELAAEAERRMSGNG